MPKWFRPNFRGGSTVFEPNLGWAMADNQATSMGAHRSEGTNAGSRVALAPSLQGAWLMLSKRVLAAPPLSGVTPPSPVRLRHAEPAYGMFLEVMFFHVVFGMGF